MKACARRSGSYIKICTKLPFVTYADLSESSDNEAIGGLLDEHTIGKDKKHVLLQL